MTKQNKSNKNNVKNLLLSLASESPIWDLTLNNTYTEDIYSKNGVRLYGEKLQSDYIIFSTIHKLRNKPNKKVKIYKAIEIGSNKKFVDGDMVTILKLYAKAYGEDKLNHRYKIIHKTVTAKELFTRKENLYEWTLLGNVF